MFAKVKQRLQDMGTVKRLCEGAEGAARRAGQELPGAEHYVLSALELDEGSARRCLPGWGWTRIPTAPCWPGCMRRR